MRHLDAPSGLADSTSHTTRSAGKSAARTVFIRHCKLDNAPWPDAKEHTHHETIAMALPHAAAGDIIEHLLQPCQLLCTAAETPYAIHALSHASLLLTFVRRQGFRAQIS